MLLISDLQMSVLEFSFLSQWNIGLGLFQLLLLIGSIFLILLILVQRGKGGGLTGALGGMGGQSAFGAKAGDAFTKVTVVTSLIWITLCMVTIALFNQPPPKTVNTTKSAIDIARDIENGVSAEDVEIDPDATGEASIGAPDDSPKSPADQDAEAETSDAEAETAGAEAETADAESVDDPSGDDQSSEGDGKTSEVDESTDAAASNDGEQAEAPAGE